MLLIEGRRTALPLISIEPCVTGIKPAIAVNNVDLPQPDGPSRMNFSPFADINRDRVDRDDGAL